MGLLRTAARTAVISGTATAVSGRVAQRQALQYQDELAKRAGTQPATTPPSQGTPVDTPVNGLADIEHLATLHKQKMLTDAEFAAAKAKILGI